MGLKQKLIQWGWIDAHDRLLTWRHWKENKKPHRQAVAYLRDESGKLMPLYNFLARDFTLRERKAA